MNPAAATPSQIKLLEIEVQRYKRLAELENEPAWLVLAQICQESIDRLEAQLEGVK